jgi:exodeoxyribonuclease V alpha subunit
MNNETIVDSREISSLNELDIQFGTLMNRLSGQNSPDLFLAAALVSRYRGIGHICVDLSSFAGKMITQTDGASMTCPALSRWLQVLETSSAVGRPHDYRPLILNRTKLYLYRYWEYENRIAENLKTRAELDIETLDRSLLQEGMKRLLPLDKERGSDETDWKKVAAFMAISKRLCVISGGPGTGKTFTIARILALLIEQHPENHLRIALTAPTGKATARLQESIRAAKATLQCDESVRAAIPETASTVHRLLGIAPHSALSRYHARNPLPVDVVIVDEASMVGMALFSKLVQAVPLKARLLLIGDRDQLASVEAGAVLGDICDTGNRHGYSPSFLDDCRHVTTENISLEQTVNGVGKIGDCIVQLQKSYRFKENSGIRAFSSAVNEGNGEQAIALLKTGSHTDVTWRPIPNPVDLARQIEQRIVEGYAGFLAGTDPLKAFDRFNQFRILCALRDGPYGVRALNLLVERILHQHGIIRRDNQWYCGRPVMILKNDYPLKLFNGDVGIVLPDPELHDELRVFFPSVEGRFRSFSPLRLPDHETVFAMTVHKSQGSEFEEVLFIMPDRDSPVLTRELIYTAVTRAKKAVQIWGNMTVFNAAVSRRTDRKSGLRDQLWSDPDTSYQYRPD